MRTRAAAMGSACASGSVSASEPSEKRQSLVKTLDCSRSKRLERRGNVIGDGLGFISKLQLQRGKSSILVYRQPQTYNCMESAPPEGEHSFDSSLELDDLSLTQTTNSPPHKERTRTAQLETDFFPFPATPLREGGMGGQEEMFVGFKNGWGGKSIKINESKLKMARQLMGDTQEQVPAQNWLNALGDEEEEGMMTMPCFKAVGSGAEVKVSEAAREQATRLFRQFQSNRKPTKMKKTAKFTSESMIKTFSLQSKIKPPTHQPQRESFNWEEYEKEYRSEVERVPESKSKKRTTLAKRKQSNLLPLNEFVLVKLMSLSVSLEKEKELSGEVQKQTENILCRKYSHNCGTCRGLQCVLCRVECPLTQLSVMDVYGVLNERFSKERVGYEQFLNHYSSVCFKLLRHSLYWPDLVNKQCQASNILVQIHRRTTILEKTDPSFLRECLTGALGRAMNVVVRDKCMNEKLGVVYLLLSDGWEAVWAAIGEGNLLFSYVKGNNKVRVGTKLCLALWDIHPISNILAFCPKAPASDRCLEFFYNGSIILKANAKLGRSREEFYRPLPRCRAKGGLVPVIEGIVIRLFAGKNASKRGRGEQSTSVPHFAELLTPEGLTSLVRFLLPEDGSLVQYFRLYHCYRLYRLKIGEEQMLTFLMGQSQLRQMNEQKVSEKEGTYPPSLVKLLSQRFLNNKEEWKQGVFDVLCANGKAKIKGKEWGVEVQGETGILCAVYQQVSVSISNPNCLHLTKLKWSSQLRKPPRIYQQLY